MTESQAFEDREFISLLDSVRDDGNVKLIVADWFEERGLGFQGMAMRWAHKHRRKPLKRTKSPRDWVCCWKCDIGLLDLSMATKDPWVLPRLFFLHYSGNVTTAEFGDLHGKSGHNRAWMWLIQQYSRMAELLLTL